MSHAEQCTFSPPCTTKAEMRERHGTPEAFRRAVWDACTGLIVTVAEYEEATDRYEKEYEETPE